MTDLSRTLDALKEARNTRRAARIYQLFPDTGPYRRELYPKHLQFLAAGRDHRLRAFMAGNRVGKSLCGAAEVTWHCLGEYPPWWEGRRFDNPITAWVAGDSAKTVRDIIQVHLLGRPGDPQSGLIPPHRILDKKPKPGVPDALEVVYIRHRTGRPSVLFFKSYDQEIEAFQGSAVEVIWLDEEPPMDILTECLLRTTKTSTFPGGIVLMTFTPCRGVSPVVQRILPGGRWHEATTGLSLDGTFTILCAWDEVPHLPPEEQEDLRRHIPAYQLEARTRGLPVLGAGLVYPIDEAEIVVPDFAVPASWPRGYGMDAAWNWTAAVWGAWDPDSDTLYITHTYKRGQAEPPVHADAIRRLGAWIPGFGDLAEVSRYDGRRFVDIYQSLGLNVTLADRGLESGILATWTRMTTGRLKIFQSATPLLEELRLYRRNEQGQIIKRDDHLVDALRYLVMATPHGLRTGPAAPVRLPKEDGFPVLGVFDPHGWMA